MCKEGFDINEIIAELEGMKFDLNTDVPTITYEHITRYVEWAKAVLLSDVISPFGHSNLNSSLLNFTHLTETLLEKVCDDYLKKTEEIIRQLPTIKRFLIKDTLAIYHGDPAAMSIAEVVLCYPGFLAELIYRIAHCIHVIGVPYMPRMLSEYAHEKTGIDIHPGAKIGESLCIDHGTGIVIGETAEIGDEVRIYQGVTIGAKSIDEDFSGNALRGKRRHPTIGNRCIIYAGATILGGNTVIGDGCVIGGNVWITHSIPSYTTVYYDKK